MGRSSETQRTLPRTVAKLALDHRGYRKAWPRERFFLRARRYTPVVAVSTGGARYFVSTADEAVGLGLFAHGSHEREQLEAVSACLERWSGTAQPLHGKRFLDIGANIGTSIIEAAVSLGCAGGWALEPHPENFRLLRHNLLENDLDDRVEALEVAVTEADGRAVLEIARVNMGDHRVRVGAGGGTPSRMAEDERETIDVPARSVDSLVADGKIDLADTGLAWIDTQGHEAHVLAGATSLARASVPAYVEYWPYALERAAGRERFHELVREQWTQVADIGFGGALPEPRSTGDLAEVIRGYDPADAHAATNLLLLP